MKRVASLYAWSHHPWQRLHYDPGHMPPSTDVCPPPVQELASTNIPPIFHPPDITTPNVDDALALVSGDGVQPVIPPGLLLSVACPTTDPLPCDASLDIDQDNPGTSTIASPGEQRGRPSHSADSSAPLGDDPPMVPGSSTHGPTLADVCPTHPALVNVNANANRAPITGAHVFSGADRATPAVRPANHGDDIHTNAPSSLAHAPR
jgi:hypothetical protein